MKYKVGDKVRVRDDLELGKWYSMNNHTFSDFVNSKMITFKGKEVTILADNCFGMYRIKEDNGEYHWTDEMFSGLATNLPKVVITTDGKTTTAKMYEGKKVLKTAKSQYSPEDTFDFAVGAKLALERVTKKDLKFKIGQFVRVIENDTCQFFKGQPVKITEVSEDYVMCEGYLRYSQIIGTQLLRYEMIESLPEDGE